jgi:hypothetical protein
MADKAASAPGRASRTMTPHRLRRGIIAVLSIKISVVVLAALFVFGPNQRPPIDGGALDRQILNNSYH